MQGDPGEKGRAGQAPFPSLSARIFPLTSGLALLSLPLWV